MKVTLSNRDNTTHVTTNQLGDNPHKLELTRLVKSVIFILSLKIIGHLTRGRQLPFPSSPWTMHDHDNKQTTCRNQTVFLKKKKERISFKFIDLWCNELEVQDQDVD